MATKIFRCVNNLFGFTTLLTESKYFISVMRYLSSNNMVYFSPHALFSQARSHLKDHKDTLMKKVLSSSVVKTPDDVNFTPDAFKNHLKMTHFQNWRDKPMHGQYICILHDNNNAHSFEWLINYDLKTETESLIFAAQDQAVNTKYYNSHILGWTDSSCRFCSCGNETDAYIVSGCSNLAGTLYKKRHDAVGR